MQLRGGRSKKAMEQRRRERAQADVVDMRAREVIVEGVQYNKEFSFDLNGHHIGKCAASRVYFENGQRVAEVTWTTCPDINAMYVRLLRAFYNIEARAS